MKDLTTWLKGVLDSQSSASFGRTGAAFVVYFLVVWGCYIVSKSALIPDVPYGWITIIGILWGVSGAKEAYLKGKEAYLKGKEIVNPPPPPPENPEGLNL